MVTYLRHTAADEIYTDYRKKIFMNLQPILNGQPQNFQLLNLVGKFFSKVILKLLQIKF